MNRNIKTPSERTSFRHGKSSVPAKLFFFPRLSISLEFMNLRHSTTNIMKDWFILYTFVQMVDTNERCVERNILIVLFVVLLNNFNHSELKEARGAIKPKFSLSVCQQIRRFLDSIFALQLKYLSRAGKYWVNNFQVSLLPAVKYKFPFVSLDFPYWPVEFFDMRMDEK